MITVKKFVKGLAKRNIKKAFTMAEAILVMTILGIIATIMITTLRPAEYKDKALAVLAKKVFSDIDNATSQILTNNSSDGTFCGLVNPTTNEALSLCDDSGLNKVLSITSSEQSQTLLNIYKLHITTTRKACDSADCPCYDETSGNGLYLKNGACMNILAGGAGDAGGGGGLLSNYNIPLDFIIGAPAYADVIGESSSGTCQQTIFPGESQTVEQCAGGYLMFDTNGADEPNILGKDQYVMPLAPQGIMFEDDGLLGQTDQHQSLE